MKLWIIIKLVVFKFVKSITYFYYSHNIDFNSKNIYLFNTPEHGNLGDHMIAQATIRYLNDNFPDRKVIEITQNHYKYRKKYLKKYILSSSLIIITGGGYLGDIWKNEQDNVFDILDSFPKNKIIIFPQTISFKDKSNELIYKEKYNKYTNLIIVLRDRNSFEFLKNNKFININNLLYTPDIVLSYSRKKYHKTKNGILMCMRADKEKVIDSSLISKVVEETGEKIIYTDTVVPYSVLLKNRINELEKKLNEFASCRLVITDRLHGMIFAYLTSTPCIAFDNSTKKVSGVYKWINQSNCIKYFESESEDELKYQIKKMLSLRECYFQDCKDQFFGLTQYIRNLLETDI